CQQNLLEIHRLARAYADRTGHLPFSPEGGAAALRLLREASPGAEAEVFSCKVSKEAYELPPWRLEPKDSPDAILVFDHAPDHNGLRNVAQLGGRVQLLTEARFQKKLEADRKRFGARAPAGENKP